MRCLFIVLMFFCCLTANAQNQHIVRQEANKTTSSYQKSTKSKLVGTWKVDETYFIDDFQTDLQGTVTNKENGTSFYKYRCMYTITSQEDDILMKLCFTFSGSSKWLVKGDEIVDSPLSANIEIENIKFYDLSNNSFLGEFTKSEAENFYTETVGGSMSELKKFFMKASTERILMIDENRYVTESIGEDGNKSTTTYNRIK